MRAEPVDLRRPRRVHIVGVGGAGMSGLARILKGLGHEVTGSDLAHSPTVTSLAAAGVTVEVGHDAANLGDADLVTASPAVPQGNVELVEARSRGIDVATRAEMLGALCLLRATLAVAGTHGKTTTSSMLTLVLETAGRSPSWLIGADVAGVGANARLADGVELVMEADESYGTFSELSPALTALGTVEADHLDHYGTLESLVAAFAGLLARSGESVVHADHPTSLSIGREAGSFLVGSDERFDAVVRDVALERASSRFVLELEGTLIRVQLGAPGRHNVANAALAATVAVRRGVPAEAIAAALGRFAGVPRRFEFRGDVMGATAVDDYAHLPGEVAVIVATARTGGWRRVVAVFQPHRYTRTAALASQFAGAFDGVDLLVVTDIYSAGEPPIPGVTGRLVAEAVAEGPAAPRVQYVPRRSDLADHVAELLEPGDLLLTMGAGDLTTLPDELRGRER
jgi:UDP-N-acetylmuramate--alanine ligase